MTNLEKAIEMTGKFGEGLKENGCPLSVGIIPKRNCDEQCSLCWEEEFWALIPDCYKQCQCRVCKDNEYECCANETDKCKGNCVVLKKIGVD